MKKYIFIGVVIIVGVLIIYSFMQNKESTGVGDNLNIIPETKTIINLDDKKIMNATLHTNKGDITIEFFESQAPNTVANFIKLAKDDFYNGVKFHRVIKGFMIQSGDPLTKDDSKMDFWGTGGPDFSFADELGVNNKNDIGTIAMANSGPNTNGSQFFINVAANNFLDTKHTVFGKVTVGMDVVTKIENTPTDSLDRPMATVFIESISLTSQGPSLTSQGPSLRKI